MTMKPPRCLDGLVALPAADPGVELDMIVEGRENRFFSIGCACGGPSFAVRSVLREHWYLKTPVACGPVRLRCAACGRERESFNPAIHGYDAEIGYFPPGSECEGEPRDYACPACAAATFALTARFEYPDSAVEAAASVERGGRPDPGPKPEDLFSFFTLIGACDACGTPSTIATVECL